MKNRERLIVKKEYRIAFVLVTSLFFIWGFTHTMMDVLNKHFQGELGISISHSSFVQTAFFLGYFLFALPAGSFLSRYGYRKSMLFGLTMFGFAALLFGIGSHLFSDADKLSLFYFFLLSLFLIASGLVFLEVAASPYITQLGDRETAPSRLNFAQSINGLGNICGPWVGGLLLFSGGNADVSLPYMALGLLVLVISLTFSRMHLPEIQQETIDNEDSSPYRSLWHNKLFVWGFIALFFYEIAEIGINSMFINYAGSEQGIEKITASQWLSFGYVLFMCARFTGGWLMSRVKATKVLWWCAWGSLITNLLVFMGLGTVSLVALMLNYVFEAIMFPTIFSLALQGLGDLAKRASAVLMLSTIGGAVGPLLMGAVADVSTLSLAFIVPLIGYLVVLAYSWRVNTVISGQAPKRKGSPTKPMPMLT